MEKTSQISGFYKLSRQERAKKVADFAGLSEDERRMLEEGLPMDQAERMVENVVSTFKLPLGMAVNFLINGKDYIVPMATEETSVVAAASNMAKAARKTGGFSASTTEPLMIGQIQLLTDKPEETVKTVLGLKKELIDIANAKDSKLISFGGGARDVEARVLKTGKDGMAVVHLIVDVRDAMGANIVNTMCEAISPIIAEKTGAKPHLKIISNLAVKRLARANVTIAKDELGGEEVVDAVLKAYEFADLDFYRAVTHNKGVMNGITAVTIATGNDSRAVEAGAHSYAAYKGTYKPITRWRKEANGDLYGEIELPLPVGIVGGATMNPSARMSLKILGVKTARELAEVMASVGLAQNLAAMRALATEGIQRGHMSLHAKNIAMMAGAQGPTIDEIADQMVKEKNINVGRAKELLDQKKK